MRIIKKNLDAILFGIALGVATVAMAAISLSASLPQAAAGETPVLPPWDLATSPGAIAW